MNWSGNSWLPQNTTMWKQDLGFNRPLPATTARTQIRVLYGSSTGAPIINNITIIDEYTIKICLREPKASWIPMLCFAGSSIMSPTYLQGLDDDGTGSVNEAIDVYLSDLFGASIIGTGPFIFDTFVADIEVGFDPNPNYWQGAPKLTSLTFVQIEDATTRNQALLSGDIDVLDAGILPAFLDQFEADPNIDLINGGGTLSTLWVTFNYTIPTPVRKAISWCFNYSYLIDVIYERSSLRLKSPVPAGLSHSNYSYDYPTFDIAKARSYLFADTGYNATLFAAGITPASPDSAWITLAGSAPLVTYNFTWNAESIQRGDVGFRLKYDMLRIGMHLDVVSVAWGILIDNQIHNRQNMELYTMGWLPDYSDPENYILPIWDEDINGGDYYEADMHGPGGLYELMLTETDFAARDAIFQEIQQKMIERDFPGMYLITTINWDAFQTYVRGWVPNPLRRAWFYPVYIAELTPPDITIHSPVSDQIFGIDTPTFNITITDESPLDSTWYTIDGGLTFYTFYGLSGAINQTAWDSAPQRNIVITFYAEDDAGNIGTSSVTVKKSILSEPPIPGYNVFLIFGVISLVTIILIKKIKSK